MHENFLKWLLFGIFIAKSLYFALFANFGHQSMHQVLWGTLSCMLNTRSSLKLPFSWNCQKLFFRSQNFAASTQPALASRPPTRVKLESHVAVDQSTSGTMLHNTEDTSAPRLLIQWRTWAYVLFYFYHPFYVVSSNGRDMSNKEFFIAHTPGKIEKSYLPEWESNPRPLDLYSYALPVEHRSTNPRVVGSIPAHVNKIFQSFQECTRWKILY